MCCQDSPSLPGLVFDWYSPDVFCVQCAMCRFYDVIRLHTQNPSAHSSKFSSTGIVQVFFSRAFFVCACIQPSNHLRRYTWQSVLLLVNCCLSDATAHKYLGFGLPKWFMFLLVVVYHHCSRLPAWPKTFVQQLDEINICVVDLTQIQNISQRNN